MIDNDRITKTRDTDAIRAAPSSVLAWLLHGERGISSNTIVSVLCGFDATGGQWFSHPLDPADMLRCQALLDACPELLPSFREKMPLVSAEWRALVENWEHLLSMIHEDVEETPGRARRAYGAMSALLGGKK